MNRLESTLVHILSHLNRLDVDCALVGGLAVSVRAEPRFTRDVDLAVAVRDDAQAESLTKSLLDVGYRLLATVEQEAANRLATARLLPPGEPEEGVVVDLLFASSGIEPEVVQAAERIELFPGVLVKVAGTSHLIALKVLARDESRPQDEIDLQSLLANVSDAEINEVGNALDLVAERGYERGRDLLLDFEQLISRFRA
jgi:hypothetical protein